MYPKEQLNSLLQTQTLNEISLITGYTRKYLRKYSRKHNIEYRNVNIRIYKKKYIFNESFFETIDTEEKAYWLGFIAADGHISESKRCLSKYIGLSAAIKDELHMEKYRVALDCNKPLDERKKFLEGKIFKRKRLILCSKKMFNDLLDKGITPRKSLTLEPPKNVQPEHLRHWIRGYFDGDGSVGVYSKGIKISILGTENVLKFIKEFVCLTTNVRKRENYYKLQSTQNKALKFLSIIYDNSTIYLDRKKEIYINFCLKKVA